MCFSSTMLWFAAALAGLLLSAADYPLHVWPLGIVALTPMLWVLSTPMSARRVANAAVVFGVAYAAPLAVALGFPWPLALGQVLIVTAVWTIAWLGVARALRLGPVAGPLTAAAFVALVEWANFTFVPLWGTAQCFVRTWSAWPPAIQTVAFWGMSGLVFQVVAVQALAVSAVRTRPRYWTVFAAVWLVWPVATGAWQVQVEEDLDYGTTVAAIGWAHAPGDAPSATELLDSRIVPDVMEASSRGARLVVTPELGLVLGAHDRPDVFARLAQLAKDAHLTLAIGWYDLDAARNQVTFFDAEGHASEPYLKTHLVPFVESYPPGDGKLIQLAAQRRVPAIGAMICQDDNFTDLAREYGRRGVGIVAVPTHDWREVAPYHLENSRFRAVENRYAVVRAAANGTSAIISRTGRVLASRDHFKEGDGLIVAKVAGGGRMRVYSWFDWPPFAWLAILGVAFVRERRARVRS
jgi:apolipoprotein N-acyltransferase